MKTLIVNFKNYSEVLGDGSVRLAGSAERISAGTGIEIVVAPPVPSIAQVARSVKIPVYAQGVSPSKGEKTTGSVTAESARGFGARGSLVNHSEARLSQKDLRMVVSRLGELSMDVCLCAGTAAEIKRLAVFMPRYLAVEPPDLIGSGIAVSKARPQLVTRSVEAARSAGYSGQVLCGAGIVSGKDVEAAVELGADGVLVSSSVVKAKDWDSKLSELARSLR